MLAIDTNVLIRALVDDDSDMAQCLAVRARLEIETAVYVPLAVLLETIWTLSSTFALGKTSLLTVLHHLRDNHRYVLQSASLVAAAIADYQQGPADFPDYLILAEARAAQSELLTLDKKLLKSTSTQRVPSIRK